MKAKIKEIFQSIQGEGLSVGEKQLFIRFAGCNLNCAYCDTDFSVENSKEYTKDELLKEVEKYDAKTLSLTGGEPLLHADFLLEFLPSANKNIYLETNGTLFQELDKIKDYIDVVAMDIKLESATKNKNRFEDNKKFLSIAPDKTFVKVVFDSNIKEDEIDKVIEAAKDVPLVLQPKMPIDNNLDLHKIFNRFYTKHKNVKLIPQTHKFLNLR